MTVLQNQQEDKIKQLQAIWNEKAVEDNISAQSKALNSEDAYECFYKELEFGTGGIRGEIGAGTNRMNVYTVGRATQGIAEVMKQKGNNVNIAIGYDSRHKSDLFARHCAKILAANGITVHLFATLCPTPCVSYAVRSLGCVCGIMITASHNPGKYNGYKVYGDDGCQLNLEDSKSVMNVIEKTDYFDDVLVADFDEAIKNGTIKYVKPELMENFYKEVLGRQVNQTLIAQSGLNIVYTPLNGAGNVPVRTILAMAGIKNITVVPEQENPDGNFPTCPFPNPEIKEALQKGLDLCEKTNADLLLATDPDCDRVGIAVKQGNEYILTTGNEVGVLLTDYLLKSLTEQNRLPKDPIIVKTIVTTPLIYPIAKKYGAKVIDVLTGFKFIGEQIKILEEKGQENRYIFGFEESYGYLSGTYVRDKDAVVASLLICEMAAYYKKQNKTLIDVLQEIYTAYGIYYCKQDNFYFEGSAGMTKMQEIISSLQNTPPKHIALFDVVAFADYAKSIKTNFITGKIEKIILPKSDVIILTLGNGSEIVVRPSGTEPKIKVYYTALAKTVQEAQRLHLNLAGAMAEIMK